MLIIRLVKKDIFSVGAIGGVILQYAVCTYAVFFNNCLPKLTAHLIATLANLQRDYFAGHCVYICSLEINGGGGGGSATRELSLKEGKHVVVCAKSTVFFFLFFVYIELRRLLSKNRYRGDLLYRELFFIFRVSNSFFFVFELFIAFSNDLRVCVCGGSGKNKDVTSLHVYKSSSSSGSAVVWACLSSSSYFWIMSGSIFTSGGASAGEATNSRLGSPTSLRASHRKGFSKL